MVLSPYSQNPKNEVLRSRFIQLMLAFYIQQDFAFALTVVRFRECFIYIYMCSNS